MIHKILTKEEFQYWAYDMLGLNFSTRNVEQQLLRRFFSDNIIDIYKHYRYPISSIVDENRWAASVEDAILKYRKYEDAQF